MNSAESFQRFEQRAEDYAKYRPRYPAALLNHWWRTLNLRVGQPVADVGSGTGIFTQLLLERGLAVHAVEPSDAMRGAAEAALRSFSLFVSVNGTADTTTLASGSVEVIFCAQAFHWFNHESTRSEWRRILRPNGFAALVWNNVDYGGAFGQKYLAVLREVGTRTREVQEASLGAQTSNVLFPPGCAEVVKLPNEQQLDLDGFIGRTVSNSFMPKPGDARFSEMVQRLEQLFAEHQRSNLVRIGYATVAISGQIGQ